MTGWQRCFSRKNKLCWSKSVSYLCKSFYACKKTHKLWCGRGFSVLSDFIACHPDAKQWISRKPKLSNLKLTSPQFWLSICLSLSCPLSVCCWSALGDVRLCWGINSMMRWDPFQGGGVGLNPCSMEHIANQETCSDTTATINPH